VCCIDIVRGLGVLALPDMAVLPDPREQSCEEESPRGKYRQQGSRLGSSRRDRRNVHTRSVYVCGLIPSVGLGWTS
jgi:hypothetical protein